MSAGARTIPLPELSVYGLAPMRQHSAADLERTWMVAHAARDVAWMAAVAAWPETPAELVERALQAPELAVREALASRPDLGWQFQLRVLKLTRTASAMSSALTASGWCHVVVDDVFEHLRDEDPQAPGALQRDRKLVDWLWENAYPEALTSSQCLWLLQQNRRRLVRDDGRALEFTDRLDGRDVGQLLRLVQDDSQLVMSLLSDAPAMDADAMDWAMAWAGGQGPTVPLVVAAMLQRFEGAPQLDLPPGWPSPPPGSTRPRVAARRTFEAGERRRVALNWAWLVRSGSAQGVSAVKRYVRDLVRRDAHEDLFELTRGDYVALVWLLGQLRMVKLLPLLRFVDVAVLTSAPAGGRVPGVHVPDAQPGRGDLEALGADAFVLRNWPKVAPRSVARHDGWDQVSRVELGRVMGELEGREEDDVLFVCDVLEQDPPDVVVGMVPAGVLPEVVREPRMAAYLAAQVPGEVETLVLVAGQQPAETPLAQVVSVVRAVLSPAR